MKPITSLKYASLFLLMVSICACNKASQSNSESMVESQTKAELSFEMRTIADSITFLWAYDPIDITGDGIADLVFTDNNPYGGQFGYYEGSKQGMWTKHLIEEDTIYAMGDIEGADMDGDGDLDIIAAQHPGEWKSAASPSSLFWYENPAWQAHPIGEASNFIKDVSIGDFNNDGKKDVAVLTFEDSTLRIFQQNGADDWTLVQDYQGYKNLHEGMDVGDVNGDGFIDIVAEAHIFYSPGEDLTDEWGTENLDHKWNTQTGDWSRNGTKIFLRDLDQDGQCEVFISHSERTGYPLSMYRQTAEDWQEVIIADSIPACHTLQVFDFNKDGVYEVLAGVNYTRAKDLGLDAFPIIIFQSSDDYNSWTPEVIREDGIYNGQTVDYDGDGDLDIFRYQTHDATTLQLMENKLID